MFASGFSLPALHGLHKHHLFAIISVSHGNACPSTASCNLLQLIPQKMQTILPFL